MLVAAHLVWSKKRYGMYEELGKAMATNIAPAYHMLCHERQMKPARLLLDSVAADVMQQQMNHQITSRRLRFSEG